MGYMILGKLITKLMRDANMLATKARKLFTKKH